MILTAKRLREVLSYNKDTGIFIRIKKTGDKGIIGKKIGSLKAHGYLSIQIDGVRKYAHQLAWLYMTGEWPSGEIDHKNNDRSDNRWLNLREATRFLNNGNRKKHRGPLPKGVVKITNRGGSISYRGRISMGGKQIHLGSYKNPIDAHAAYMKAAKKQYGTFARSK